jgi:hypothetical protein
VSNILNATIQIKQGTAAQWVAADPILLSGEWGLATDTKQIKMGDGSTSWSSLAKANANPVMHIQRQEASGTGGGAFLSGDYRDIALNTEIKNTIIEASWNTTTYEGILPAGVYIISAWQSAYRVNQFISRLINATTGALLVQGTPDYSGATVTNGSNRSTIDRLELTLTEPTAIKYQARAAVSRNEVDGFGITTGTQFTVDHETYADLYIEKIG